MLNMDNLVTYSCYKDSECFWKAIKIWLKNPHVVNRRILASTEIFICKSPLLFTKNIISWIESIDLNSNFINNKEIIQNHFTQYLNLTESECSITNFLDNLSDIDFENKLSKTIYLRVAKLLPRNNNKFSQTLEFSLINIELNYVLFFYKSCSDEAKNSLGFPFPYQIDYINDTLSIKVLDLNKWNDDCSLNWLKTELLTKLIKWIENDESKNNLINGSLKLVSSEKYSNFYNELKKKYSRKIIDNWTENTDPLKFVNEDIAIAAYLLLLWESEREKLGITKLQSFLDLGCGNGLLVYILASEGHKGEGIDLRKRKIWDSYPENTKLTVKTIIPSAKCLFPDTDWLIGNHSDELTPWIPVIAARSSYECNFFLLPCCAYEFDGRKYQRENSNCSQYFEYMNYVKEISEKCGFKTSIDKLRIPSTKRTCIIGTERNYSNDDYHLLESKIPEIINSRSSLDFKPRENTEKVKNCTQIDKTVTNNIVNTVVSLLLNKNDSTTKNVWNPGGAMDFDELVSSLDPKLLKELKDQCGGLQTLLRNNADIFKIDSGKVRFRIPGKDTVGRNSNKKHKNKVTLLKVKPCWFYNNHPDGCPVTDIECSFKH